MLSDEINDKKALKKRRKKKQANLIKSLKPIQIRNLWNSRSGLNWKAQFSTSLILNYEIKR